MGNSLLELFEGLLAQGFYFLKRTERIRKPRQHHVLTSAMLDAIEIDLFQMHK